MVKTVSLSDSAWATILNAMYESNDFLLQRSAKVISEQMAYEQSLKDLKTELKI